jgi:hypothetical protein
MGHDVQQAPSILFQMGTYHLHAGGRWCKTHAVWDIRLSRAEEVAEADKQEATLDLEPLAAALERCRDASTAAGCPHVFGAHVWGPIAEPEPFLDRLAARLPWLPRQCVSATPEALLLGPYLLLANATFIAPLPPVAELESE